MGDTDRVPWGNIRDTCMVKRSVEVFKDPSPTRVEEGKKYPEGGISCGCPSSTRQGMDTLVYHGEHPWHKTEGGLPQRVNLEI